MAHQAYRVCPCRDGEQKLYRFSNGYGASVVRHSFSYGHEEGLRELAVIRFDKAGEWDIVYDTPITSDVIGSLTPSEVETVLDAIAAL